MKRLLLQLRTRPRLVLATVAGALAAWLLPRSLPEVQRAVVAWNIAIWLYLLLVWIGMARLDHAGLRRLAAAHADSASMVLALAVVVSVACLVTVLFELASARADAGGLDTRRLVLAVVTLVGSWLLLPTEFALTYASKYFSGAAGGLGFPGPGTTAPAAEPNYVDFLYFSITVAATSQTSDVAVTTRAMRRLVIVHSVLSFGFNALVLALAINLTAGLF